jgi:DNA-directed RNA polymerase specialized sigma24 family protein
MAFLSDQDVDALVGATVAGDEEAWQALWLRAEPLLWAITGRWRVAGRLSRRADDRLDIVVRVMASLRDDDFRRLRLYLRDARRDRSLEAWLATVARHTAISHVRAHAEYLGPQAGALPARRSAVARTGLWVTLVALSSSDEEPVEVVALEQQAEARKLIAWGGVALPRQQAIALGLWCGGEDHAEIGRRLGLDSPMAADQLVRAALRRLRKRFRSAPGRGGLIRQQRATRARSTQGLVGLACRKT